MLLTFTFGLAVVPFSNVLFEKWSEILVKLPEAESEVPIIVMVPTERRPFNMDGGGCASGTGTLGKPKIIRKRKNEILSSNQ
jgi:hypothetical protein